MAIRTEDDIATQVETEPYQRSAPITRPLQTNRPRVKALTFLLAVAIFVVTFILSSFRSAEAIDIKSDEATYVIESVSLYRTGMTQWDGAPFLVHPPLFFMVEGAYFKALGIGQSPLFDRLISKGYVAGQALLAPNAPVGNETMFDAIYASRMLSALFGALTAVMLFFLGRALVDWRLGLLTAAVFMLDPYVVWRLHLNYLEPLAGLFGVLMYYEYITALSKRQARQRDVFFLFSGFFFGLALLTKELALLYALPIALHWLLFRRLKLHEALIPLLTGVGMYLIFPIWASAHGLLATWWNTRNWLFDRLTGQIKDSGISRPGVPFTQTLGENVPDYWPWFLLMGVAGLFALLFLYLHFRRGLRDAPAELLTSLVLGTYTFFMLVGLMGGVLNEHFFYFLMPFVVMAVAYGVMAFGMRNVEWRTRNKERRPGTDDGRWTMDGGSSQAQRSLEPTVPISTFAVRNSRRYSRRSTFGMILLGALLLLLAFNLIAWVGRYVFSRDDSFAQVEGKLAQTLPPGTTVVGRDLLDLYLMPKQNVYTFSYLDLIGKYVEPANIVDRKIPYAILNDQSLLEQYGGANSVYYDWVHQSGDLTSEFQGRLYNTYVYHIDYSRVNDTFDPDSIAVGRPAVASSTEDPTLYGPANAFDAHITTRWASKETDNEWIYVDLGQSRNISKVVLSWEDAFAKSYQLQVSDDAVNWHTFYSTNQGAGGLETINAQARGRYVRLLLSKRGTPFGYSLWEIAIYP